MSDRATALVQLGKEEYLDVCSMPDLFHFKQMFATRAGAFIGKAYKKALENYEAIKARREPKAYYSERYPIEAKYLCQEQYHRLYRDAMDNIHKIVHPFSASGLLQEGKVIKQTLLKSIEKIEEKLIWSKAVKRSDNVGYGRIGEQKAKDSLPVELHLKAERQIPDIIAGVESWQEWLKERTAKFVQNLTNETTVQFDLQVYLIQTLLPWMYWQEILKRTPAKARNENLRIYYEQLITESSVKYAQHILTAQLSSKQMEICLNWAQDIVRSFQRSSSQVEGRNGYLAFIHKANRGLPENRLKVLTTIHNFDIKRSDGSTPAQRLWKQDFPDLFEFVLLNVTGFKEPRRSSRNSLIVNSVRA